MTICNFLLNERNYFKLCRNNNDNMKALDFDFSQTKNELTIKLIAILNK